MTQLVITIGIMAVFLGFAIWMYTRSRKAMSNLGPRFMDFFQKTGYRLAHMPDAPLEVQAEHAAEAYRNRASGQPLESHWVLDWHGLLIYYDQFMGTPPDEPDKYVISASWSAPLAEPPRVRWHIAHKRIGSTGEAVKEMFTNQERIWSPAYPDRIESGDPEIDRKYKIFGEDPAAVRTVLQTPGLKEALAGCVEVDLRVLDDEVRFSDPLQKNLQAGMGGGMGAMAAGYDMDKMMDMTIPVHRNIVNLV